MVWYVIDVIYIHTRSNQLLLTTSTSGDPLSSLWTLDYYWGSQIVASIGSFLLVVSNGGVLNVCGGSFLRTVCCLCCLFLTTPTSWDLLTPNLPATNLHTKIC